MHKSQIFGYLLVSFLIGIFISPWFSSPIQALVWGILIGTIIVTVSAYEKTFVKTKKAERNRRVGVLIGCCVLALAAGIFRYGQANLNQSVLLSFADVQAGGKGIAVEMKGYVDNEMTINGDRGQVVLHVTELNVPGQSIKVDERTLVFTKATPVYHVGDQLRVVGALVTPKNFADGFDYVQYLKNKEIRTTVPYPTLLSKTEVNVSMFQRLKLAVYRPLFRLKDNFQSSIARSVPEPYAAYLNGVLLGTKENLPADIVGDFNKTSTSHILAISGYNITIIAEALLACLVFFMRRQRAFWVSVGCIVLFTIMTGAGASVVRAAVMGILLLTANSSGRWYDPKNSILLAAAVMVFLDPLSLRYDVGFQLSFLAVLGLLYIYPVLESRFKKIPEAKGLKETFLMSLSAQIAVAPLLAYIFHTFSIVSLPANLLVLPFMPYTMLFAFLTGVGGMIFWALGRAIGLIALALSWYQLGVIKWMASLSFAAVTVTIPAVYIWLIYIFIALGTIIYFRKIKA